jgi:large subunit ribosomal protein L25
LIDVTVDSQASVKVLVKEVQRHVLSLDPIHVDLYQVRMDTEITARVPLVFVGESSAVKNDGGTLVKSMDELEVECLPGNLPHEIQIDLSKLTTFEDAITVGSLSLPVGVKIMAPVDLTIASVSRPLTEDELKKMEAGTTVDVSAIKTEGEEKRAAEEAKKAEADATKE